MNSVIRSVYGAKLQTAQLLGLPLVIPAHSTLNEKFNINANMSVPDTTIPHLKYVGIGNGGHRMVAGANGISFPQPIQHLPRHAALYNQLPFVLRLPTNDLTPAQRAAYRLRTTLTIAGVTYIAYYLKVLDLSGAIPEMDYYTVANGVTTATSFSPNSSDLNPTPPDLNSTGVISTTGDYIAATSRVPFVMTASDLAEFSNVANVLYNDTNMAIISEIALCSGVDKDVIGSFNGVSASYTEAIGVQVMSFISAFYATQFSNTGINVAFDVGSVEALLATTN